MRKNAQAARRFADHYAAFDPRPHGEATLDRAEQLLAGAGSTRGPTTARESIAEPAGV